MARITEDKKWQGRMDADTLSEAKVIEEDNTRLKNAKVQAKVMADDAEEKADAMKSVANRGSKGSSDGPGQRSSSSTKRPRAKAAVNSLTSGIPGVGGRRR